MWHIALFIICGIAGVFSTYSDVYQDMLDNLVQPDVVLTAPNEMIQVNYPSGAVVNLGNHLNETQIVEEPSVKYDANPKLYYTLCLTEPDEPSEEFPTGKEFIHWLIVNIPGNDTKKGETIFSYNGSTPIRPEGLNRYVFLLYEQPKYTKFNESKWDMSPNANRSTFSIFEFSYIYNFTDPIAGNLFLIEYNSSTVKTTVSPPPPKKKDVIVPTIEKQIIKELTKKILPNQKNNTNSKEKSSKEVNSQEKDTPDSKSEEENDLDSSFE